LIILISKRGEILTSHFLETGEVLSPQQVSEQERYYLPYLKVKKEKPTFPIVVGMPLRNTLSCATNKNDILFYLDLFNQEQYVLSCCSYVNISLSKSLLLETRIV